MKLHEFMTATLCDIQKGVHDAIELARTTNLTGAINPVWGGANDAGKDHVQLVQFDIAVTAADKVSGTADGGIKVIAFRLGATGEAVTESSQVSRIQFSIPLIPPVTTVRPAPDDV